jgi:DGQHR domain-containing protein
MTSEKQTKKAWLLTATLENWYLCGEKGLFGSHGNRSFLHTIKKGDQFVAYAPSIGFVGYGAIEGEYFESNIKIWNDRAYKHRFQISTPVSGKVLPATSVIDDLEFVKNKKNWGVFFKAGVREIPISDFNLISKKIDLAPQALSKINSQSIKETSVLIGNELHNRVLKLFQDLGFTILESNYTNPGPDITVMDPEGINQSKIIIQCKNSRRADQTFTNLDKHLHEYSGRLRSGDAQAAILVISGHKLPRKVPGESGDLNLSDVLQKYNVAIWTDETLSYYEKLIEKISRFARYQVLSDLNLRVKFADDIEVDSIKIKQNGYTMYAASLSPSWLLKAVSVVRRIKFADGPQGYQRILDRNRIIKSNSSSSISNYIDTNDQWLFPNAIVLASSRGNPLNQTGSVLRLSSKYGQFWVIDGQHRLFAFANAEARKKDNKLFCVIIDVESLGDGAAEERELAQIFVTLNGKGKRVPKALLYELYELLGSDDNPSLEIILNLVKDDFFTGSIRGYSDKEGSINLVSFADAKGTESIFKYFQRENPKKDKDEIIEIAAKYILDAFKLIAKTFETEWSDPDVYFLKTDRGVRGMLSLLALIIEKKGSNQEKILEAISALKKSEFDFLSETATGLYLGAGGPNKLAEAFAKHISKYIDFLPNTERYQLDQSPSTYGRIDEVFLSKWISQLKGNVRCQMNFIDKTTIKYLSFLNFEKVKNFRMFFGNCDSKDEKNLKLELENLREKGLNIILTRSQKRTETKGSFFHSRWIGDDEIQVDTEVDLKDNSQRNSTFHIHVNKWSNPPELDDFERYWKAAEMNRDIEFGYNWGISEE